MPRSTGQTQKKSGTRNRTSLAPIPKAPNGKPIGHYTPEGKFVRDKDPDTGKLYGFPRGWKPDPATTVTPETRDNKNFPICGVMKSGKSSSGEGQCCMRAGWGTDHPGYGPCKLHGGNRPNVDRKYQKQKAATMAERFAETYNVDPHSAILEEIHRTAGKVRWYEYQIMAQMDMAEGKYGPDDIDTVIAQWTPSGMKPSVYMELYQTERAHLVSVCKNAVTMGVAERQVRIAEELGHQIAMVLQAVINDQELGMTPAQMLKAPKVIRKHLMTLPSGETKSVLDVPSAPVAHDTTELAS